MKAKGNLNAYGKRNYYPFNAYGCNPRHGGVPEYAAAL